MLRTLATIHPTRDMRTVEEMLDQMFGSSSSKAKRQPLVPSVDIIEREGSIIVTAPVPGVSPENLKVDIQENILTISGESVAGNRTESDKVYLSELNFGEFARSIRLPKGLDIEAVSASFENGMVTITLPRIPIQKPQVVHVPVRTTSEQRPENTSQEQSSQV